LNGSKYRLSRREDTVGQDKTYTKNRERLQHGMHDATLLKEASYRDVTLRYVSSAVPFNLDRLCRLRVLFRDVTLKYNSAAPASRMRVGTSYISGQERVHGECTSFTFVVGEENDAHVFDAHDEGQGPNDDREGAKKVGVRGIVGEGGGVYVERAGSNIAIDDTRGLVDKPDVI
jgi:hypothetical protein